MAVQYEKAPIIEALIDLRVSSTAEVDMPSLHALSDSLRGQYPASTVIRKAQVALGIGPDIKSMTSAKDTGLRLTSADEKEVFQAQVGSRRFFHPVAIPQSDFSGMLILTQSTLESRDPETSSVVLDIDVFRSDLTLTSNSRRHSHLFVLGVVSRPQV